MTVNGFDPPCKLNWVRTEYFVRWGWSKPPPIWIHPEIVRQALLNLLSITESNSLQGDYSRNDVVLRPLSNGQIYEWIYFGETGAKFRFIQIARRHRATIYD